MADDARDDRAGSRVTHELRARWWRGPSFLLFWSAGNLLLVGIVIGIWLAPAPGDSVAAPIVAPTATDIPLRLLTPVPGFALTVTPGPSTTSTPTPAHAGGSGALPTATPAPPTPTPQPTATPIPPTPTERPTPNPQS